MSERVRFARILFKSSPEAFIIHNIPDEMAAEMVSQFDKKERCSYITFKEDVVGSKKPYRLIDWGDVSFVEFHDYKVEP